MEKEYFVLYTPTEMQQAYELLEKDFSEKDLQDMLKNGDDIEKQVCLIKLNSVNSKEDAENLAGLLTGQHGPIREICSAKINNFLKEEQMRKFFAGEKMREICLNALNDIIPTVARNILEVIKYLPETEKTYAKLTDRILALRNYTEDEKALSNHEIIKKTFKLYWYLETLVEFSENFVNDEKIKKIIEDTYQHEDYTIREKIAKILSKTSGFEEYKNALKNDENPYVFSYLR